MKDLKILNYLPSRGALIDKRKAVIYGRELFRLAQQQGGLTPETIVEEAKNSDSPFHEWFQWDKGKAAENWWKQQARQLCNAISVEVLMPDGGKYTLPLMESITVTIVGGKSESTERRYVTVKVVKKEEAAREQIKEEAIERLNAALQTIQDVVVLGGKHDSVLQRIINMLKTYLQRKSKVA